MVISRIPHIEAAFEKVFHTSVKVKVEVINNQQKQNGLSEKKYLNHSRIESLNSHNKQGQEIANYDDKIVENELEIPLSSNPINSHGENKIIPEVSLDKAQFNDVVEQEKDSEGERQDLALATSRIVNFFQGEIIDIESIKFPDKTNKTDKTDLPVTSKSIDFQDKKSKNSHVDIQEAEEDEKIKLDDDVPF